MIGVVIVDMEDGEVEGSSVGSQGHESKKKLGKHSYAPHRAHRPSFGGGRLIKGECKKSAESPMSTEHNERRQGTSS
jgi:hypothetical protein